MKKYLLLSFILFCTPSILQAQETDELTLEDIFDSQKFAGDSLWQAKWIPETDAFTFLQIDTTDSVISIYTHDVTTGEETPFLDGHTLHLPDSDSLLAISGYSWSEDGSKILIRTNQEEIWRRSLKCAVYVYDVNERTIKPVFAGEERIANTRVSPDGARVGYVYKNNIYTLDLMSGETAQWTTDGSEVVLNGKFDWVYEEELGITQGWEWSPDSRKISFWRLDQSPEPEFSWLDYNPLHQKLTTIRYPKPGEPNALVKIGVVDLATGKMTWMDLGEETDIYIPRIKWTEDPNFLSIQRLNRRQNRLELLLADIRTGKTEILLAETDSCWVRVHHNLFFLEDRKQFVWTSERSGYNHIYLYRFNGELVRQLTSGQWEVGRIYGVDEKNGRVFYASNEGDITESHLYRIDLDGDNKRRLTVDPGWHRADFSCDYSHFIDRWSNSRTPQRWELYSAEGTRIRTLVENTMPVLDEYALSYPEFLRFTTADGAELAGSMIKPPDFDENKKYPVLVVCYGGPGGPAIRNMWHGKGFLWDNLLAQHGYLIFRMNNRGSGGRGKAMANMACGDLARWAVFDHIEGAKYLAGLPYVDQNRIGIRGWSFGGYLTLLAMTKGAEYFAVGVAGAPVTDWRLYDNIYTERYMGLPGENSAGYDSASIFPAIDRLKGKLLIIHGMADDNVHVQNTMQLIEKLQAKGIQFDLMVYPGQDHSVRGKNKKIELHLYSLMTRYILDNL